MEIFERSFHFVLSKHGPPNNHMHTQREKQRQTLALFISVIHQASTSGSKVLPQAPLHLLPIMTMNSNTNEILLV